MNDHPDEDRAVIAEIDRTHPHSPVTAERVEYILYALGFPFACPPPDELAEAANMLTALWASKEAGDKRIAAAREALGLLNSMILSGESHTAASLALFKKGMGDDS